MNKSVLKSRVKKSLRDYSQFQNIANVALFGSQVSGVAKKRSDVDLLVQFKKPVGFFEMARLQRKLEKDLQKKVDIVTPAALSEYFRDEVIQNAELIYEK